MERHDIVSCHCQELDYVHVPCVCHLGNSSAVSTATKHQHWNRARKCMISDVT